MASLLEDEANLSQQKPSPDLIHSLPPYESLAVALILELAEFTDTKTYKRNLMPVDPQFLGGLCL